MEKKASCNSTKKLPLGKRLRECRGSKSAREVADILGITQQALTGYERGRSEPNCAMLAALARHYRVTTDWLLGLTNVSGAPLSRADTVTVLSRMVEIEAKAQAERQALLEMLCHG